MLNTESRRLIISVLIKATGHYFKEMNIKQELKQRKIKARDFAQAIGYTEQGLNLNVGSKNKPKDPPAIFRYALLAFLAERAGVKLEKLI